MKILFLDIDGVVWTHLPSRGHHDDFNPICVDYLNYIMKEVPELKIVISSSWRATFSLQRLQDHFESQSFLYPEQIIDVTPDHCYTKHRGEEIQEWLDKHKDIEKIAILDDDSDMVHLSDKFVKTEFNSGLTKEKAEEVIKLLKD